MVQKLRSLAFQRFSDDVDALIEEDSQISRDRKTVTVSATAIQYKAKDEPDLQKYEQVVNPPEQD